MNDNLNDTTQQATNTTDANTSDAPKKDGGRRGRFQDWDKEKLKEVSRRGGVEAHRRNTAHRFTSDEAKRASLIAVANRKARKSNQAA
jgi:hypothetical protein